MESDCFICFDNTKPLFKICKCNTVIHSECQETMMLYLNDPSVCPVCLSKFNNIKRNILITFRGYCMLITVFTYYLFNKLNKYVLGEIRKISHAQYTYIFRKCRSKLFYYELSCTETRQYLEIMRKYNDYIISISVFIIIFSFIFNGKKMFIIYRLA